MRTQVMAAITITLTALAGCVTDAQFEAGVGALKGRPLSDAIQVLGYPTGERRIAGTHIVHWGAKTTDMVPVTTFAQSTQTGSIGKTDFDTSKTTRSTQFVPVTTTCDINLQVNENNIIVGGSYAGDLDGCHKAIRAMDAYRASRGIT
ncbi:hypothetical protein [Robbsia sp. KACC 23696]|uniref:hypothetical protein n=1 Tax=Robbsia sp. KACC 23696 TaxID=3149231 RepID=UPI00325BD6CC